MSFFMLQNKNPYFKHSSSSSLCFIPNFTTPPLAPPEKQEA